ncbi:hypothetical protein ASJ79_22965 [Mycobacterium sp. NAZ190054]|nr:hypothetical protein ASJ79_22965 [Mycobacterium sp. NAZ190054]
MISSRPLAGVALVTLNRPDSLNALTPEMFDALADALRIADADDSVGCIVITGAGRGFCAGGSTKVMASLHDEKPAAEPTTAEAFEQFESAVATLRELAEATVARIYGSRRPTIALVNGPCAGAGMGLACACDFRIASESAIFTTAYANVGVSGDLGSSYFLRHLVGPSKARELMFTAARVDAATAASMGLVGEVVADDELLDRGLELAERIAAGPIRAYGRMKDALRAAETATLAEVLDIECRNQVLSGRTVEGQQTLREFIARKAAARG